MFFNENYIVCGRGQRKYNSKGNRRLRSLVALFLAVYIDRSTSRTEKSKLVNKVTEDILGMHMVFVKPLKEGRYEELTYAEARAKVAHRFRDAARRIYSGEDKLIGSSSVNLLDETPDASFSIRSYSDSPLKPKEEQVVETTHGPSASNKKNTIKTRRTKSSSLIATRKSKRNMARKSKQKKEKPCPDPIASPRQEQRSVKSELLKSQHTSIMKELEAFVTSASFDQKGQKPDHVDLPFQCGSSDRILPVPVSQIYEDDAADHRHDASLTTLWSSAMLRRSSKQAYDFLHQDHILGDDLDDCISLSCQDTLDTISFVNKPQQDPDIGRGEVNQDPLQVAESLRGISEIIMSQTGFSYEFSTVPHSTAV